MVNNEAKGAVGQGNAAVLGRIGLSYLGGGTTGQNYKMAYDYLKQAAELGNAEAMHNLGKMYSEGKGVKQDKKEAAMWFRKAADLGNVAAKRIFGEESTVPRKAMNTIKGDCNDVISKLQEEIARIQAEPDKLYIVNAGRMNHGKSSLFNSLLDKDAFATGDIRTTVEESERELAQGVYLLDTPGLDAEVKDDSVAFAAYKKANMVLFVHTPNAGELHRDELERIKAIESLFPDKQYFWKHFCLVLTFLDSVPDSEERDKIKEKIAEDIERECQQNEVRVFEISNTRYTKGMQEQKVAMVEMSGIPELRNYLLSCIEVLKQEAAHLRESKIANLCAEAEQQLVAEKEKTLAKLTAKKSEIQRKKQKLAGQIKDVYGNIASISSELTHSQNSLSELTSDLDDKRSSLRYARSRYYD